MITTQKQLRAMFWEQHPQFKRIPGKTQNDYVTDVRVAWCEFTEHMYRSGKITQAMVDRATL